MYDPPPSSATQSRSSLLPISLNRVSLPEKLPPILLVAFTRPDLLEKVLIGLSRQTLLPQKIIALIDGARSYQDRSAIEHCIQLLTEFSAQVPVEIRRRTKNLGCDLNIVLGITEVLAAHPALIYLEDDIVPNPHFYDRMCRLLEAYDGQKQVFSVSAYASFPAQVQPLINTDFSVSNRVFSWGLGLWADRWHEANLAHQGPQYNPFGSFFKIPPTLQTKMTLVNQFWLEKNSQTDWVITMTLAALHAGKIHIIPKTSLVENIGFGHPEAKTYHDQPEAPWVNAQYAATANPDSLPEHLALPKSLQHNIAGIELAQHLAKENVWLNPCALLYLLRHCGGAGSFVSFLKLFVDHSPTMLRRVWRGLPI